MDIKSIKIFADLVETNSFTKASSLNFVTQSAVSQRMRSVEIELSSQLMERTKGRVVLTPQGEAFYKIAKQMLKLYQNLMDELKAPAQEPQGELRVATIYSVGLHELPPYIKRFMKKYPKVNLRIEYHRSNQIYDMVSQGVIDIGIVAYPVKRPRIKIVPFKNDKLILITHPKHNLARSHAIDIRKLHGLEFVAFEKDIPTRKAVDRILKLYKTYVNTVLEFDNIETLKRAVEIGTGVSIVPSATVVQELNSQTLSAVGFSNKTFLRPIGIIYKDRHPQNLAETKFIEMLGACPVRSNPALSGKGQDAPPADSLENVTR